MTKYRLLIVDDEELIRRGLQARIRSFGMDDLEINTAASGTEALECFAAGGTDVALVDISMPDMNGLDLIERARELSPATRFILLSGFAEFSYAQRAIQLRVQAYLNKPVSNQMLREQLERTLDELRREREEEDAQRGTDGFDLERELNALLSGELAGRRMEDACPGLCGNYPFLRSGTGKCYLAILHLSRNDGEKEKPSPSRLNAIRSIVKSILEKTPCGCERLIVNSYQNPQRMYALFIGDGGSELRAQVERMFLTAHTELEQRVSARITIGVGLMTVRPGTENVGEAREALRQRYVQGRSNIYFYEDVAAMEAQSFPEAELELLRKCMERGDKPGVHRQLEWLFSEKQLQSRRAVYLHALWVRIAGMVMRLFNDMDSAMISRLLSQLSRVETMVYRDEVGNLMEMIDSCMDRRAGYDQNAESKVGYAMAYIRKHFHEDIIVNDLASTLDMSPGYFSSAFKKEAGVSAMQYVTNLRVERAKEYLTDTEMSVAAIAQSVGYADVQYFYRVFKKTTGMTPLQFRQEKHPEM